MSQVHLITFSDESMSRARQLCISSFKRQTHSLFVSYSSPELLKGAGGFYDENRTLLDSLRGCGYWTWKPYIINQMLTGIYPDSDHLRRIPEGDILIYADAGIEFINSVNHIIDRMDQDIFLFGNNYEHAHWCKRDIVETVWPAASAAGRHPGHAFALDIMFGEDAVQRTPWQRFGKQVQASVIFFRVSDYTRKFVKEWLDWCLFEGGRLIDDSPSRTPNHPEFRENRHDQAILTTMAYRDGLKLHYWPASYNDGAFTYEKLPEYTDDYPVLFNHHRKRNHEWKSAA